MLYPLSYQGNVSFFADKHHFTTREGHVNLRRVARLDGCLPNDFQIEIEPMMVLRMRGDSGWI